MVDKKRHETLQIWLCAAVICAGLYALGWFALKIRPDSAEATSPGSRRVSTVPVEDLIASEKRSARRLRGWQRMERERNRWKRIVRSSPSVTEAINLSCDTYGYCSTLWRKARCETGGTFSPRAHNASGASGLFQFLPGTFASTPYARESIWSPYANAMAAGWMHAHGRGGEWDCA